MKIIKRLLQLIVILALPHLAFAQDSAFVVKKIEVNGLQRVTVGTVLSYLPIKQGETLEPQDTGSIVSALYNTGFFTNVTLSREGNTLIINVTERPTIASINIKGNKKIPTKKLKEVLKNIGIVEGNAFDSSTLAGLKESLENEYATLGQYNATVTTRVIQEPRDRVAVDITINEGHAARIKKIIITGNRSFSDWRLLRQFQETTWRPWVFFTKSNQYSADKLDADLETLSSYYLDRGYLRFKINSYKAELSPDTKSVIIRINITEGSIYRVKGYTLSGNLLGQETQVRSLINLKPGEVFSRQKIVAIDAAITHYYGDQGYAFTNVTPTPVIDDANQVVIVNFAVQPGSRVYVRRISFSGNTKTQDIVLRREMRQEEGGLYSLSDIEESKRRLSNLGFLQNIQVQTQPVPGHPDQVDVNYNVTEMSSATASMQVGYSDAYGILYGANLNESNLLGTGKQVTLGFQNSRAIDNYSFSYINPYYTESGISRGISVFAQRVTPGNAGITPYTSNILGANVTYGMPISEFSSLSFGYGYQNISISPGTQSYYPGIANGGSLPIAFFLNRHGTHFNQVSLNGGWSRSTYDRSILPTSGSMQQLSIEAGVPVLARYLEYYKLTYQGAIYYSLPKDFILHLYGVAGYGNGYGAFGDGYESNICTIYGCPRSYSGTNSGLPFFKNFFAGGIDSVRGYESNTLGPKDNLDNPIGGNVLTTGSLGLIIPNPYSDRFRPSIFLDAGNVFDNQFALSKIRLSTGVGVQWYIPMMGPLEFALAHALNSQSGDQPETFEFSVGTSF